MGSGSGSSASRSSATASPPPPTRSSLGTRHLARSMPRFTRAATERAGRAMKRAPTRSDVARGWHARVRRGRSHGGRPLCGRVGRATLLLVAARFGGVARQTRRLDRAGSHGEMFPIVPQIPARHPAGAAALRSSGLRVRRVRPPFRRRADRRRGRRAMVHIYKPDFVKHDRGSPIFSVDCHPDGTRLAAAGATRRWRGTCAQSKSARWRATPTSRSASPPSATTSTPSTASASAKRPILASGSTDTNVFLYEKRAGPGRTAFGSSDAPNVENRCQHLHGHLSDVIDIAWAPDDNMLASCS